ncbi:hypothetical protein ACFW1A_27730 [Kitasatospora sp. NPDC058965]|uniref:hypothetical protein n=1 Tax=Kitasatospora sp. NPDC058965 TaxID=3346682 RepID=UPI00368106FA
MDLDPSGRPVAAAGPVLRCSDQWPHVALGGAPIAYVSVELWQALTGLALVPAAAERTALALLRTIAADAVDAATLPGNEAAPRADLWVSAPAYIGGTRRVVWFQRVAPGGAVTAYFAPAPR